MDRHDHEHSSGGGRFYVATRLGDFVQQDDEYVVVVVVVVIVVVGGGGIGNDAVVLVHPCNADERILHPAATSRNAEKNNMKKKEEIPMRQMLLLIIQFNTETSTPLPPAIMRMTSTLKV